MNSPSLGHADVAAPTPTAASPTRLHPTASARDATGEPLDRGAFAAVLVERLAQESIGSACHSAADVPGRRPVLTGVEAQVVAELLDELSGVYPDEAIGQLSGSLSARIWTRLDL